MIYTQDRRTALNPRHVISVETADMGDEATMRDGRRGLTGKPITAVLATVIGGGVHVLYRGTDEAEAKTRSVNAIAQIQGQS